MPAFAKEDSETFFAGENDGDRLNAPDGLGESGPLKVQSCGLPIGKVGNGHLPVCSSVAGLVLIVCGTIAETSRIVAGATCVGACATIDVVIRVGVGCDVVITTVGACDCIAVTIRFGTGGAIEVGANVAAGTWTDVARGTVAGTDAVAGVATDVVTADAALGVAIATRTPASRETSPG